MGWVPGRLGGNTYPDSDDCSRHDDSWACVVNFSEIIVYIYYGCECLIAQCPVLFSEQAGSQRDDQLKHRPTISDRPSSAPTARRVHGPTTVARNIARCRHNTTRVRRNNTCPSAVIKKRSLRPDCTERTFSRIRADQPTSSEKSVAGSLIPQPCCVDKTHVYQYTHAQIKTSGADENTGHLLPSVTMIGNLITLISKQ